MITNKIFLDANIFNDIFDKGREKYKESKSIFQYALKNKLEIYTSCDIITNIYYITAKYTSKENALISLESLQDIIKIIPFSQEELSQTIKLMKQDKDYNDMEDTIQYILAEKEKCDFIITNDKNFTSKNIECLSSKQFCEKNNIGF